MRPAFVFALLSLATMCLAQPSIENDALQRLTPVPDSETIPAVDFFRPNLVEQPRLNPAGTHFATLVGGAEDRQALLVYNLESGKVERLSGYGKRDIYAFHWLDDTRLIFSLSKDKQYSQGLFVTRVGQLTRALPVQLFSTMSVVGVPTKTPLRPLVWVQNDAFQDSRDRGVVQVDVTYARERDADAIQTNTISDDSPEGLNEASIVGSFPAPSHDTVVSYMADAQGELAFAITMHEGISSLYCYKDRKWTKSPLDPDSYSILGAGDQHEELIVSGPRKPGKPAPVRRVNVVTGEFGEVLLEDGKYDADEGWLYRHPVTRRVLGVNFDKSGPTTHWLSAEYESLQKTIQQALPGQVVRVLGSDRTEKKFFLGAMSDRNPGAYFLLDLAQKKLTSIQRLAPWIDEKRMRPMQVLSYKARDGAMIEGFLTLPAGVSKAHPAPMIVLPHGGPYARDVWGFNGEVQFFASRGYAVFQPNYRGSTGTQWAFSDEDLYAYRKMHDDVTDGVHKLIQSGLIDPTRIAIVGTSFGGYLAVCGAAFEPTLYRCCATISGVFDWELMVKESRRSDYTTERAGFILRHLGDPEKDRKYYDEISPLRHVANIKIPVFVAHGRQDENVSVEQSEKLISALKENHVPYESQLRFYEGHGMSFLNNRVEMYTALEKFLSEHMQPVTKSTEVAGR